MSTATRPPLTTFAILFGLLAVSNLLKPLQLLGGETGFVFLGERLTGTANAIAGTLAGLYLLVYAFGLWRAARWAVPIGWLYVGYVVVNLVMFTFRGPPQPPGIGYQLFGLAYAAVAIGVSTAAVRALGRATEA
jgi:hypothetical protein